MCLAISQCLPVVIYNVSTSFRFTSHTQLALALTYVLLYGMMGVCVCVSFDSAGELGENRTARTKNMCVGDYIPRCVTFLDMCKLWKFAYVEMNWCVCVCMCAVLTNGKWFLLCETKKVDLLLYIYIHILDLIIFIPLSGPSGIVMSGCQTIWDVWCALGGFWCYIFSDSSYVWKCKGTMNIYMYICWKVARRMCGKRQRCRKIELRDLGYLFANVNADCNEVFI